MLFLAFIYIYIYIYIYIHTHILYQHVSETVQIGNFWALEEGIWWPEGPQWGSEKFWLFGTDMFFISNSISRVNIRVAQQTGIKATICKINSFSIVTSICPKYCLVLKTVVEKFSISELKLLVTWSDMPASILGLFCLSEGLKWGIKLRF